MVVETNWYVVTGGPNCGKSPIMEALAFRGYTIRPEAASVLINQGFSEGKTLEEIREDEIKFQNDVLDMKIKAENVANPNELIFWERGIPDSVTYLRVNGGPTGRAEEASRLRRYKGIFVLDLLQEYVKDHRRTEGEEKRKRIHKALIKDYEKFDYSPIIVPVMPISDRVSFILEHLNKI